MSSLRLGLAFLFALVWLALADALSGALASSGVLGPAAPDLGIVLFIALCAAAPGRRALPLAVVAAAARAGLSIEPRMALLTALVASALAVDLLRGFVDPRGPFARAALSAGSATGLALWTALAAGDAIAMPGPAALSFLALATALAALAGGGVLARLPGLAPLGGER